MKGLILSPHPPGTEINLLSPYSCSTRVVLQMVAVGSKLKPALKAKSNRNSESFWAPGNSKPSSGILISAKADEKLLGINRGVDKMGIN